MEQLQLQSCVNIFFVEIMIEPPVNFAPPFI